MTSHYRQLLLTLLLTLISGAASAQYMERVDSADNCLRRHDWTGAERHLRAALSEQPAHPANFNLLSNLGVALNGQERYAEALQAFNAALGSAPRNGAILANRARTLMQLDRPDEALRDIDQALLCDSLLYWPRLTRALHSMALGRTADALSDLNLMERNGLADADVHLALSRCLLWQQDLAAARSHADRALEMADADDPARSDMLELRATLRILQDDTQGAAEDIAEALKADPDNGNLYVIRAYLAKISYRPGEAEQDLKNAVLHNADTETIRSYFPEKVPK